MEKNENNFNHNIEENKDTEKKKKRPTLTYYQPPGTRLIKEKNENIESAVIAESSKINSNQKKNVKSLKLDIEYKNDRRKIPSNEGEHMKPTQVYKDPIKNEKNLAVTLTQTEKEEKIKTKTENSFTNIETDKETPKQAYSSIRGGIIKVSIDESLNDLNDKEKIISNDEIEKNNFKTLFDPNNPTKPIYVQQSNQPLKSYKVKKPIHFNNQDQQQNQHQSVTNLNAINEAKVNTIIESLMKLEPRLKSLIENCDFTDFKEHYNHINEIKRQYENLCVQALLTHIELSTKLNIDLNYWKLCYHQIIENLRKEHNYALNTLKNLNHANQLKKYLEFYINNGFEFYDFLMKKLEEVYNFDKEAFLDLNKIKPIVNSKTIKLALLCMNRCFICLGDLARYRESLIDAKDYGSSRSYYLKAMYLAPKCSRAYNQLAVLALYTRRRLDAVYYYMRCLELKQPLITARQSLISLFDEARKRSEIITENLNKKKKAASTHNTVNIITNNTNSNRVELWINSLNSSNNQTLINKNKTQNNNNSTSEEDNTDVESDRVIDDDNDKNELLNLSSIELNKRFMHDYLNLIGKLFTKVGMESYEEVCSRMLYEFFELLKRDPCPIGKIRLLQITIINISIVNSIKSFSTKDHTSQYKNNSENYNQQNQEYSDYSNVVERSQLQEFSIQLSLDMFAIIIKQLTRLLSKIDDNELLDIKIRELLPSVKIFSDWMMQNSNLWFPLPDQLPPSIGPNPDLLKILTNFFNELTKIDCYSVKFFNNNNQSEQNLEAIFLDEDREINGFLPFRDHYNKEIIYTEVDKNNNDLEYYKDYLRLNKILYFADYLCNLKKPIIKYDIMNKSYIPALIKNFDKFKQEQEISNKNKNSDVDERNIVENIKKLEINNENNNSDDDKELNDLIEKRKILKAKVDEKLKIDKSLQSIIDSTTSRRIEIEIRPRFLVPDTNCFIDHLNLIDNLLKSNRYIIVVPLLVINELDKLSKSISNYNDDSIEHAEMVQLNAKKSMNYLNEKFENRERNIKALTSQGSVLDSIQFRSEELKAHGNNDDLILGCCLHYCRDNARDFMPSDKNDAIHLFREVVLLTEDRNLRLKAHTRNVPVRNIISFCKWTNIPLTKKLNEQLLLQDQQQDEQKLKYSKQKHFRRISNIKNCT